MLEQKTEENSWQQIGIVVANSINEAAEKIGAAILEVGPLATEGMWAELENNYFLEEFVEVKSLSTHSEE